MWKISRAEKGDIPRIKQIEIGSGLSPWSEMDYELETEREDSLFFVAKRDRQTIGFVLARLIMNKEASSSSEIEIFNIAAEKTSRRNGIASSLLEKLLKIGSLNGVQNIFLEVRESNLEAQKFYRKHRFEISGKRKNFYSNPPEDAFLMCLCLN